VCGEPAGTGRPREDPWEACGRHPLRPPHRQPVADPHEQPGPSYVTYYDFNKWSSNETLDEVPHRLGRRTRKPVRRV